MDLNHSQPAESRPLSPAPLFSLGQVVATPAIIEHLMEHGISARIFLHRHQHGDWGDVCSEDAAANDAALRLGSRILSSYECAGERLWIITESDRSVTTLLRPDEY